MPGSQPIHGTAYDCSTSSSPHSHSGARTAIAALGRTRSGQRMWSDPVPSNTKSTQLASQILRPSPALVAALNSSSTRNASNRTAMTPLPPSVIRAMGAGAMARVAGRDREDIPLRPLPSTLMAHYRDKGANVVRTRDNLISSIHDLDLYEDDQHAYDAYVSPTMMVHSTPRAMRQAPKLLTLDDYNLISLGYKPVMLRKLPWVSLTGMAATASNVFTGVIALYGMALTNGGPAWTTWSFMIVGLFSVIVSLCIAELASAYPTTAGVHHWVYQLGSAKRRAYLSWMVGWFTIVSSISITASVAFFFSSILGQLLQSIHKSVLTTATLVTFHLGVLFVWQMFNLLSVRILGTLSTLSGTFAVGLLVALVSVLLSMVGIDPATTSQVPFATFLNYSGSPSASYAAISSMLMASFVFCPQDTVIRMSEESRRPERTMPRLLIGTSISNILFGFPLLIALNYSIIKPMKGLLDEDVPAVRVILETLSPYTGTVFLALLLVAICLTGISRLAMATRTAYAFARDGGVAHSSYWNHLHPGRKTPQRVSWLVTGACMCCIFPFFWGNAIAFQWIASLGCICANLCFAIPLIMRLTVEGQLHFIEGSFSLGSLSKILHVISIGWLLLLSLALMLPSTIPLTKSNFNYAPVMFLFLFFLFAMSWVKARTDFTGGAKDVSRASHQLSSRPPLQEISPRKVRASPHSPLSSSLTGAATAPASVGSHRPASSVTPSLAPFRHSPSPTTMKKFKDSDPSSVATRVMKRPASNRVSPEAPSSHRGPTSLNPPRRDLVSKKKQPQQQQHHHHHNHGLHNTPQQETSTASSATARPIQYKQPRPQHGQDRSNITMTTIGSSQSHPSSILGLPFSDSPEMLPMALAIVTPALPSSPPPSHKPPQAALIMTPLSSEGRGPTSSELLLTRRLTVKRGQDPDVAVPAISVAPPTTSSTVSQEEKNKQQPSIPKKDPHRNNNNLPPVVTFQQSESSRAVPLVQTSTPETPLPLKQTFEDFFRHGLGIQPKGSKEDEVVTRSTRERPPTPYPHSLVSKEESCISEDARSMLDMDHVVYSTRIASPPPPPLGLHNHQLHMQDPMNQPPLSISQFPTLDGYPLIKSPSTIFISGGDISSVGSDGERGKAAEGYAHQEGTLALPAMLPLSRTPTIQNSENEYGASFHMQSDDGDSEEEEAEALYKTIGETDDCYEQEYHHSYPVFSIHFPSAASASDLKPAGLFGLPNKPIKVVPSLTHPPLSIPQTSGIAVPEEGLMALEKREDPIERILLSVRATDTELYQKQQQLQRSQSVASWAKEQARIQIKRNKRRATAVRAKARAARPARIAAAAAAGQILEEDEEYEDVKEEEEGEDSSSLTSSDLSSLSKISLSTRNSTCSAVNTALRRDSGPSRASTKRALERGRMEYLIREQDEEREEEKGFYMDTDDVLSPSSFERESLGAGVGRL